MSDPLADFDEILSKANQEARSGKVSKSREEMLNEALDTTLLAMSTMTEDQLRTLYDHLIGELTSRGLEEEITGNEASAEHSLDEEMSEIVRLVQNMRNNLSRQQASGQAVSNRDIRETIGACVNAIKTLTSHQKTVRNIERQRILETTMIEVLGEYSDEIQAEFLVRFREQLAKVQK